jgi:hypothetical protein
VPHLAPTCHASKFTLNTRQDVGAFRNLNGNQIAGMHARSFLMQIEWIAVFTMYFASEMIGNIA